jgi:hypothetical protein
LKAVPTHFTNMRRDHPMIQHEQQYRAFIEGRGVGSRDKVASSVDSYVSYLRSVSGLLDLEISPRLLSSEADVERIVIRIEGSRAKRTIDNYRSAMRQYVAFVQASGLS